MTYLENRAAYYTLFVSALTKKPVAEVYSTLAPVFLLKKTDKRMRELLENETLASLTSSSTVTVYINFIRSFCPDRNKYGVAPDEAEVLNLKKGIVQSVEEFNKALSNNPLTALAENYEKLKLSVVYALVLYVCNKAAVKTYMQVLSRAVTDADGVDACVALMYFESGKAQERYSLLRQNASFVLYPELAASLTRKYKLNAGAPAHGSIWA